ncbi:MAG: branched-chain amino acid ABC transporter permease [Thermodesulfobacteriota bacterium]|jgi:branched-chain amino acid transport system permease protein
MSGELNYLLQLFVSGLSVGSVYAVIGIGFVVIYKATKILNFAHGEILMIAAYFCLVLVESLHLNFLIAFLLTLAFCAMIGLMIERFIFRPMIGEPVFAVVMITLGLSIILRPLTGMVFGFGNVMFPSPFPQKPIVFSNIVISHAHLWTFIISCAVMAIFFLFFKYSKVGIAMRAAAEKQSVAFLMGIDVKKIFSLSWAIAAATAGIAGILLANVMVMNLNLSFVAIKVFPAIILGGLDSIVGALIGGLIIGVFETLVGGYLDLYLSGIKEISAYILLFIILIVRPYGLFGTEEIERV